MSDVEPAKRPQDHPDEADDAEVAPASDAANEQAAAMRESGTILPIPDVGQRLHATIRQIGEETTFVDYGGRSEASIETRFLKGPDGKVLAEVGEKIEAYVISNEEGVVLAPALTPRPNESLPLLREAHLSAIPVTGKVVAMNAGGLEVDLSGNRAFCPVSQVDTAHCADPSVFVGQTLEFRILEFGDMGRRIVVSRRALLLQRRDAKAASLRESLHEGDEVDGTVVRMEAFGAFVDLGGVDGMVHVSEVGHDRVNHPGEALKIGDPVRVKILQIGKDSKGRDRISLSIKAAMQDPWIHLPAEIAEGGTFKGTVVRMADFGAFVRLAAGVEGLLHTSEIRNQPTAHPREALKEGQEIEGRILKIDSARRRISLSTRDGDAGGSGRRPTPVVGETYEGVVRTHKPYGVFIDIPSLGDRMSGLLPFEETGAGRGADLSKRMPAGEKIEVVIRQIDEKGRIRLGMPSMMPADQGRGPQRPQGGRRQGGGGRGGEHGSGRGPGPSQWPQQGSDPSQAAAPRATASAIADAFRRALEGKPEAGNQG